MAISVLQTVKANNVGTSVTATITASTAGTLLLAFISSVSSFMNAPTYSAPTNFVSCGTMASQTNHAYKQAFKYENNAGGVTSVAFTGLPNGTQHFLTVYEVSGIATSNSQDQYLTNSASSSSALNTGSITTVRKNEIVFGAYSTTFANDTPTYAGSYTGTTQGTANGSEDNEYQIVSSVGSYTPSITANGSGNWAGIAISFVPPAEHTQSVTTTRASAASMTRLVLWPKSITVTEGNSVKDVKQVSKILKITRASVATLTFIFMITLIVHELAKMSMIRTRFRTIAVTRATTMLLTHLRLRTIKITQGYSASLTWAKCKYIFVKAASKASMKQVVLLTLKFVASSAITLTPAIVMKIVITAASAMRLTHLRLRKIVVQAGTSTHVTWAKAKLIFIATGTTVNAFTGRLIKMVITIVAPTRLKMLRLLARTIKITQGSSFTLKVPRIKVVKILITRATSAVLTHKTGQTTPAHVRTRNIVARNMKTYNITVKN